MRLSEFISELQKLKDEHGDLEVNKAIGSNFERVSVGKPQISYKAILIGRERVDRFWMNFYHNPKQKGEKVVEV